MHSIKLSEKEYILNLLHEVKDPEIPVLSIVDLGIVEKIEIKQVAPTELAITLHLYYKHFTPMGL